MTQASCCQSNRVGQILQFLGATLTQAFLAIVEDVLSHDL